MNAIALREFAIKLALALPLASFAGWYTYYKFDPATPHFYIEGKPSASRPNLTVAVAVPGNADSALPIRKMPYYELDAFLKDNQKYGIDLPVGEDCWPQPPSPEGTNTCIDAKQPANGAQLVKIHESIGGDRDVYSEYKVMASGIMPVSFYTVSGMEVVGAFMLACVAGLFMLLLGAKLGELIAARIEE